MKPVVRSGKMFFFVFFNKAYSVWARPWVLLCLSKDTAVVRKTDSRSLWIPICVIVLVIYLVRTMATVAEVWCMAILSTLTNKASVSAGRRSAGQSRRETGRENNSLAQAPCDALKCTSSWAYGTEEAALNWPQCLQTICTNRRRIWRKAVINGE